MYKQIKIPANQKSLWALTAYLCMYLKKEMNIFYFCYFSTFCGINCKIKGLLGDLWNKTVS